MNLIWLLIKESYFGIAIVTLTGLISGICSAKLIIIINSALHQQSNKHLLFYFVIVAVLSLVTGLASQFWLIHIAQEVVYKLRLHLTKSILAAPLQKLEELGASRLLAVLIGDVQTISDSIFLTPLICVNASIILGCFVYLIFLSSPVFAITSFFSVIAFITVVILINRAIVYFALARDEDDRLYQNFRSLTEGIKELKISLQRRQNFISDELEVTAKSSRHFKIQALKIFVFAFQAAQFCFFIILGMLVFALPNLIVIDAATISAYVLTITYLILPIQTLMDKLPIFLGANVALNKIKYLGIELTEKTELAADHATSTTKKWQKLVLKKITHSYRTEQSDQHFILGQLDLVLYPQELIFVIGGNGSGKSTFAKLITGLYLPENGEIYLDNIVINNQNREWYRQHFTVVFSDFYLFEHLLDFDQLNRLHLEDQAKDYLQQLQLSNKVKVENGKLSTTALSQGQRKRLALLTAYLEDRSIYLFDEWASDQDPLFRAIFYEQLLPNLKARGKTVIVISHDDHYFHVADRVIKLDYGKIEYDQKTNK